MNLLRAKVIKIQSKENLNIVTFNFNSNELIMMSLDLDTNVKVGVEVQLSINPTQLSLAKNFQGDISDSNRLEAVVTGVEFGDLLVSVQTNINTHIMESIITLESAKRLNLKVEDRVTLFINASQLSILEIIHD